MRARDHSPRPAEMLPPTLLPNAVLLAAPPSERLVSLMLACAVYGAMGAAMVGGARHLAAHARPVTTEGHLWTLDPDELPPVAAKPAAPSGPAVAHPGFKTAPPVTNPNVIPEIAPRTYPVQDQSLLLPETSGQPGMPGVDGASTGPEAAPSRPGPAPSLAPVDMDLRQVRVLQMVQPVYPALARLVKAQGPVELRMTIDTAGIPTDVQVLSGPHPLLIAEAVRVAKLWRFQPATVDGTAVPATFRLTVGFRLQR